MPDIVEPGTSPGLARPGTLPGVVRPGVGGPAVSGPAVLGPDAAPAGLLPGQAAGPALGRSPVIAVGRRFQPLPGTPPVGPDPAGGALVAPPGTAVHAVGAGVVTRSGDGRLRLRTDDGFDIGYAGLAPASITAGDGEQVPAGAVLGALAGPVRGPARLVLDVRDSAGAAVDPAGLLLGLPDPTELGRAGAAGGLGRDPDALDRELAVTHRPGVGDR